jgi:hypothetical protein
MEAMCAGVEDNGGEVHILQLVCRPEVLDKRVTARHRVDGSQLSTVEGLREVLQLHGLYAPLPGRPTLTIENSELPAGRAAEQVIDHYGIPRLEAAG